MRDRETGSWWQQITGKAIYGPLQGATLTLVLSDELTFGEWRSEFPHGEVLAPVARFSKDYDSNWEPEVAKLPVVISFPGTQLKSRDIVIGIAIDGAARAYAWEDMARESAIIDHVNGTPLLLVLGPDGRSFRAFVSRVDGKEAEFFLQKKLAEDTTNEDASGKGSADMKAIGDLKATSNDTNHDRNQVEANRTDANQKDAPEKNVTPQDDWLLIDSRTASQWNFQGCAISGASKGKCLERVPAIKDYWFDWRNYHENTTIYRRQ